mgnify:FL=1
MGFLEGINSPRDLKKIKKDQLPGLAEEIRKRIIEVVSEKGGHLAPNLGVVELTIALHYVFDSPKDKLIWDVGHQSYTHKLLTGRRDRFHTLREFNGMSGFPKREESPHDVFNVGHGGTSISAALGIVEARDRNKDDYKVVAIIGDGSISSGLAFEGLNHAGGLKKDLVVILNDNEMSISKNVGAISAYLSRIITGQFYTIVKQETEHLLKNIPRIGGPMLKAAKMAEESLKGMIVPGLLFEELGFRYIGPIDGHRMDHLMITFENIRRLKGPILVHVITKKGKGYPPAEKDPALFHGTPPFIIQTGEPKSRSSAPSYTKIFGDTLVRLARRDRRIVAITAAMPEGTGLLGFAREFPDRFYDVGMAEQHAVTFAAGLASAGLRPFVAIYSTFLQRAYDQIVHDVCLQGLPVVFCIDRGGIVGEDGSTHHGIFDLAYLRHIPSMTIMAPKDENEFQHMLYTATRTESPVAIRYPRGSGAGVNLEEKMIRIQLGRWERLSGGDDLAIFASGSTVYTALEAVKRLQENGISATLLNGRFIKPLDRDLILKTIERTKTVVTVEEHLLDGGFGAAVLELLEKEGVSGSVRVKRIGIPDQFIEHGSQEILRLKYGLDPDGIMKTISGFLREDAARSLDLEMEREEGYQGHGIRLKGEDRSTAG